MITSSEFLQVMGLLTTTISSWFSSLDSVVIVSDGYHSLTLLGLFVIQIFIFMMLGIWSRVTGQEKRAVASGQIHRIRERIKASRSRHP